MTQLQQAETPEIKETEEQDSDTEICMETHEETAEETSYPDEEQEPGAESEDGAAENDFIPDSEEIFTADLSAIKAKYPFVTQTHISQLGDSFIEIMARGDTDAVRAFELTHTEDIIEHRTREAVRKAYSKGHLHRIGGSADMSAEVPRDVYRQYKRLMPNVSDAEIRKHYISSLND